MLIDLARSTTNKRRAPQTDTNVVQLKSPVEDALQVVLKEGAQHLLAKAVEAEIAGFLTKHSDIQVDGKQGVVCNGYQPERILHINLVTKPRDDQVSLDDTPFTIATFAVFGVRICVASVRPPVTITRTASNRLCLVCVFFLMFTRLTSVSTRL